ncbi:YihY/virulence factor BrkB family protein [Aeromicrobium sp. YIM 150415]|uniref:YihY/virulence factor BrkB family protein n=1 Tax=Aeromicrobium sp. YIM 150415 TaxID=2803912 RepID=UPI001963395D|nr:YihY/virulence factor BrkB family protein [Aeromicrobium sp. YIM 150415]MBM9464275.1 YihY/virulence factor BrkB family protein [Aeromicrobium sp. YIM 150415]
MRSTIATAKLAWQQASSHQAPLLAAGVAFYTFTSLFPAVIAGISLYALFASPQTIAGQVDRIQDVLPADAASIVTDQIQQVAETSSGALGVTTVIALVIALYSASGGVSNLLTAVNTMYGLGDDRSFVKRKALAYGMTAAAIAFAIVAVALVAVAPALFSIIDIVPGVRIAAEVARWLILIGLVIALIAMMYRVAPNRPSPQRFVTRGVLAAAGLWIIASVGFSVYVNNFGSYGETYGALAGVVVLLLWLWVGLYAVLFGAALQAVEENVVNQRTLTEDLDTAQSRTDAERAQLQIEDEITTFIKVIDDTQGRRHDTH